MKWECDVCGFTYDPAVGDPYNDVQPGTEFAELPDGWVCPECFVGKGDFSSVKS